MRRVARRVGGFRPCTARQTAVRMRYKVGWDYTLFKVKA